MTPLFSSRQHQYNYHPRNRCSPDPQYSGPEFCRPTDRFASYEINQDQYFYLVPASHSVVHFSIGSPSDSLLLSMRILTCVTTSWLPSLVQDIYVPVGWSSTLQGIHSQVYLPFFIRVLYPEMNKVTNRHGTQNNMPIALLCP